MKEDPLKPASAKTPGEATVQAAAPCPCGTGQPYAACCGRWHAGEAAPTAEALMRSRYSAFVLGKADYLRATWHASTRPHTLTLDPGQRWLGLTVQRHVQGLKGDPNRALVAFVARSKEGGRATRMQENSRFVREDGRWYYVDGEFSG